MGWEGGRGGLRVNVVDADELVLYEDLAFFGCGDGEVGLVLEDFDAAGFLDQDTLHGLGNRS